MKSDVDSWKEWRREGIGASDAPVIMGVSPYRKIGSLMREKILGEEVEENFVMKRGKELEEGALDFFMTKTGVWMNSQKCFEHKNKNWMRATIDGINEKEKVLLEIKSCHHLHEEVPERYYPQLQHQMEVVGYDNMYYLSYNGKSGKLLHLEKDEKYTSSLVEKEDEFISKVKDIMNSGFVEEDLERFLKSVDEYVKKMDASPEWKKHAERITLLRREIKSLQKEEKLILENLISVCDQGRATGCGISLNKIKRKGSIDYKIIPELEGVEVEKYRKKGSEYWSVTIED